MSESKIVVDANILIAISKYRGLVGSYGLSKSHRTDDPVTKLFDLFERDYKQKIWYVVPKARKEAFGILYKKFITSSSTDSFDKACVKDNADMVMNTLLKHIHQEWLDNKDVYKNHHKVTNMSRELFQQWCKENDIKDWRALEKEKRSNPDKEIDTGNTQLDKFILKYPNSGDEDILAETITLKNKLNSSSIGSRFMIVSNDVGFFSPQIGRDDTVTKKIRDTFGIECHSTRTILDKML